MPREANSTELEILEQASPFEQTGQHSPIEQHKFVFDDLGTRLESLYFWLLDCMQDVEGWKVTKVLDDLAASAGAGVHADLGV